MNVRDFPSTERFIASSDFELKLVTILSVGTGRAPNSTPSVVKLSKTIGDETPKLPSVFELFQTLCGSEACGAFPRSLAKPQGTFTMIETSRAKVVFLTFVLTTEPPTP